jgi:hypothetical protein
MPPFQYTQEEMDHYVTLTGRIQEINREKDGFYDPSYWKMYLHEDNSLQETIDELDCGFIHGGEDLV